MSAKAQPKMFMCDFETTVYTGQNRTDVWASAVTEIFGKTEDVLIHHSIADTFAYLKSLNCNIICYYHNLKFDGSFWVDYLMTCEGFEVALDNKDTKTPQWVDNKDMKSNTFKCVISTMGQWYTITIKVGRKIIEIRDSMKLLPFSVKRIGESFKTKHKKLEMEYKGFRFPGCEITDEEKHYIANDVLVVREALEFMFTEGHSKLTIGACCLSEYTKIMHKEEFNLYFPNLYEIPLDQAQHGSQNMGEYIRKSYRGGWCYLVRGKENKIFTNGTTADVNSLYPSMMSSESGNYYPIGTPTFRTLSGLSQQEIDNTLRSLNSDYSYYFIRIRTRFYLKQGKLPFIQIKNTFRFRSNESLETSDYYDPKTNKYYTHYWYGPTKDEVTLHSTAVEMTLTKTDFILLKEHYDLVDFEALDMAVFRTEKGIFDDYIEKYKKLKLESKGAMRELAKLFLNNLYGKMAASTDSSFKVPFIKDGKCVGLYDVHENDKKPGYIPVGSAITSYARNFTIRAAQKNYHGVDEPGFIYADTDSIHCDLAPDEIKGITTHDKNFCCWKLESTWDVAIFSRQKTYIEHIITEDLEPVQNPYYNVKCAGMPSRCKELFVKSLEHYTPTPEDNFTEEELSVINAQYTLSDFKTGLRLPGKLIPKRIPGGILLVDSYYEMLPQRMNPQQSRKTKNGGILNVQEK